MPVTDLPKVGRAQLLRTRQLLDAADQLPPGMGFIVRLEAGAKRKPHALRDWARLALTRAYGTGIFAVIRQDEQSIFVYRRPTTQ